MGHPIEGAPPAARPFMLTRMERGAAAVTTTRNAAGKLVAMRDFMGVPGSRGICTSKLAGDRKDDSEPVHIACKSFARIETAHAAEERARGSAEASAEADDIARSVVTGNQTARYRQINS